MRSLTFLFLFFPLACLATPIDRPVPAPYDDSWYRAGQEAMRARRSRPAEGRAKNVIIFIGDGMGIPTVTAARILEGQLRGETGEENFLSFEKLPYTALAKTYNVNAQVPDSAGTATAIVTGVKAHAGVISVDQDVKPNDHTRVKGNSPATLMEIAESWGMSTGVITTSTITDATPAVTYAHAPQRGWQNDSRLPAAAKAAGFPDIARQLVEFGGNGLEVAMGGGRTHFLPKSEADPEEAGAQGSREDGRNLVREWLNRPRSTYVWNRAQFEAIDLSKTDHLLGLFSSAEMMKAAVDRPKDPGGEPSLADMTAKSIDILSKNPKGFILLVEDEWIDEAHHASNAYRALHGAIALSDAVRTAQQKTSRSETLIVVTGDHSHTFIVGGVATRGNPILGKVVGNQPDGTPSPELARDVNGLPYTSLFYGTGKAYKAPRPDLTNVDTAAPDYLQESTVPTRSEYHGAEDVPIYAGGPGAHRFHGVIEQNVIFHLILDAMTRP